MASYTEYMDICESLSRQLELALTANQALEQAILDKNAELAALRNAYDAAVAFIDSHVADPDITAEMRRTYAAFKQAEAALEKP